MKVSEMIEKLSKFDKDAEIVTFNRTSHRWFKTGASENYPIETVGDTKAKCGEYAKKQLDTFSENDVTLFF